jgi:nucleotidyltransferase/DNA polymerase involved in DNA repair
MAYRMMTLKVRFKGFKKYSRSKSVRLPMTEKNMILETIQLLSAEFRSNQKPVRLVGVRLFGLAPNPESTMDFFENSN